MWDRALPNAFRQVCLSKIRGDGGSITGVFECDSSACTHGLCGHQKKRTAGDLMFSTREGDMVLNVSNTVEFL